AAPAQEGPATVLPIQRTAPRPLGRLVPQRLVAGRRQPRPPLGVGQPPERRGGVLPLRRIRRLRRTGRQGEGAGGGQQGAAGKMGHGWIYVGRTGEVSSARPSPLAGEG